MDGGLSLALMALSLAATAASAGMSVKAGQEQKKALNEQARAESEAARMEAMVKKNELSRVQSALRAHAAGIGADADTGSMFAIQSANERMAAIDIGFGQAQRRMNAFSLRSQGKAAAQAGIISAVGAIGDMASTGAAGWDSFSMTQKKPGSGSMRYGPDGKLRGN